MGFEDVISTASAAERLGITRQRVLQLIERGRLPATKFSGVYVIREEDLKLVKNRAPGRPRKKMVSPPESVELGKGNRKRGAGTKGVTGRSAQK
jgi:excisionase family DNA binding protein